MNPIYIKRVEQIHRGDGNVASDSDRPGSALGPAADRRHQFYGRRSGHKLRPGRRRLLKTLLPRVRVVLPDAGVVSPPGLFAKPVSEVWLEIGFGAGEHLAAQARAHPNIGFLGAEIFVNGIARLLAAIDAEALDNIRIYDGDARDLLDGLPDASLDRVYVLHPDPWPKRRHHKRRLISPENLNSLARIMTDGAELRLSTDDMGLAKWMLGHTAAHPAFQWLASGPRDWRMPPDDAPATRYGEKAREAGRKTVYLHFRRHARARETTDKKS